MLVVRCCFLFINCIFMRHQIKLRDFRAHKFIFLLVFSILFFIMHVLVGKRHDDAARCDATRRHTTKYCACVGAWVVFCMVPPTQDRHLRRCFTCVVAIKIMPSILSSGYCTVLSVRDLLNTVLYYLLYAVLYSLLL